MDHLAQKTPTTFFILGRIKSKFLVIEILSYAFSINDSLDLLNYASRSSRNFIIANYRVLNKICTYMKYKEVIIESGLSHQGLNNRLLILYHYQPSELVTLRCAQLEDLNSISSLMSQSKSTTTINALSFQSLTGEGLLMLQTIQNWHPFKKLILTKCSYFCINEFKGLQELNITPCRDIVIDFKSTMISIIKLELKIESEHHLQLLSINSCLKELILHISDIENISNQLFSILRLMNIESLNIEADQIPNEVMNQIVELKIKFIQINRQQYDHEWFHINLRLMQAYHPKYDVSPLVYCQSSNPSNIKGFLILPNRKKHIIYQEYSTEWTSKDFQDHNTEVLEYSCHNFCIKNKTPIDQLNILTQLSRCCKNLKSLKINNIFNDVSQFKALKFEFNTLLKLKLSLTIAFYDTDLLTLFINDKQVNLFQTISLDFQAQQGTYSAARNRDLHILKRIKECINLKSLAITIQQIDKVEVMLCDEILPNLKSLKKLKFEYRQNYSLSDMQILKQYLYQDNLSLQKVQLNCEMNGDEAERIIKTKQNCFLLVNNNLKIQEAHYLYLIHQYPKRHIRGRIDRSNGV